MIFRIEMFSCADEITFWRRWFYKVAAWIYYRAVRLAGSGAFRHREEYPTKEQLKAERKSELRH